MRKASITANFTYLLASLVFLLFASACVNHFFPSGEGQSLIIAAIVITMITGILSIRSSNHIFKTGLGLTTGVIIIAFLSNLFDLAELDKLQLFLLLLFFIMTLKVAAKQALFSGEITINSIVGSICIYLLLGLIWALLYALISQYIPDAFSGINHPEWKQAFPDFVYFSFVVLTTLGFGDLLPVSPIARFLVSMEAVFGVFYMAIVVSSLVGAKLANSSK
jgi:voltage-gated potassium channel